MYGTVRIIMIITATRYVAVQKHTHVGTYTCGKKGKKQEINTSGAGKNATIGQQHSNEHWVI